MAGLQAVQERRQQEADLVRAIKQGAQQEAGLLSLRQLLQLRLKQQDQSLRRCQPADFAAVQAKAQLYDELLNELF